MCCEEQTPNDIILRTITQPIKESFRKKKISLLATLTYTSHIQLTNSVGARTILLPKESCYIDTDLYRETNDKKKQQ